MPIPGLAPAAISAGMGLLLEGHNDRRQLEQQQKLQDMQMKGQKEMALFNYQQQMKMWNETNYKAQVAQLNKAGLNPGLLYGMSGAGGATTGAAQGQGPGMGEAPKGGGEAMGMGIVGAQTAAQLALLKAQKENIEADTANKTATTPNIQKDTELKGSQIEGIKQQISSQKSQQALTEIETALKSGTLEENIDIVKYNMRILKADTSIKEETLDAAMTTIENEAVYSQMKVALTERQTGKTEAETQEIYKTIELKDAQIRQVANDIATKIRQLQQGDRALSQEDRSLLQRDAQIKLQELGIWVGAASNVLGEAVEFFGRIKGSKSVIEHKGGQRNITTHKYE